MFSKVLSFYSPACLLIYSSCCLANTPDEPNSASSEINIEQIHELVQKNTPRAHELIDTLYSEDTRSAYPIASDTDYSLKEGTQIGYLAKEDAKNYNPLADFGRVWAYDAGISLSLAVETDDPRADARARWLMKKGVYTTNPEKAGSTIFAGWPFSMNQAQFGDNWTDCRFMTGANAYIILSLAKYIKSDFFRELDEEMQKKYDQLYLDVLQGLLYHIESEGPNEGLATAGWTLNILEDFAETNYSYNRILDMMGYGPQPVKSYSKPIRRVKAKNVVTEHCNNVLAVLNTTLSYYNHFPKLSTVYKYDELNAIRIKLRDSIFGKLFNQQQRRFITGRTAAGVPSLYTAVDNTSWLVLSVKHNELNTDQIEALADSLIFTINTFVKDFVIDEKTYKGSYYFEDGFEDVYIEKSFSHSESYHVEGTCGLICGLLKFAHEHPEHPDAQLFHMTALELWQGLQNLIDDHGFIYASASLKNVNEPLEASISAIWYLRTKNYFHANPEFYNVPCPKSKPEAEN